MTNILPETDRGLITKDNCAVVFIDQQPQMVFGVGNIDRQLLINNVLMLAKGTKVFNIPVVLTTVEAENFSGYMLEGLIKIFPDKKPIERTGMNSWDFEEFRKAIIAAGKKNIIVSGLWTEVCVCWPTLAMLDEGYNVYVVEDACGGISKMVHKAAMKRMIQAGAVPVTSMQMLLEFQRDWAHKETYDAVCNIIREHGGAYGMGIEYAYSMLKR
jgi:nicotinamidase-related amidase